MTHQDDSNGSPDRVLRRIFSDNESASIQQRDTGGWLVGQAARSLPTVRVEARPDGWSLRAPLALAPLSAEQCWEALNWNHEFDGGAKLVLSADGRTPGLHAEFPVDDGVDPEPLAREALSGLSGAARFIRRRLAGQSDRQTRLPVKSDRDPCDLASLCSASAWPRHPRANGFAMSLETADGFHQALVEQDSRWGVVARVEQVVLAEWTEASRHASAQFLLHANGSIRFARAICWSPVDGQQALGFEVLLGWNVSAQQLSLALAALSVACRLCAREIGSLGEERIASAFLRLRGASS
jgi:hypothetical protein